MLSLILNPRIAAYIGALLAGEPDFGSRLERICERESKCLLVDVHTGDASRSNAIFARERSISHCRRSDAWSTRGAFGTMAGYTMKHLPAALTCQPWVLAIPVVAAYAAAKRATHRRCKQVRACRSWARLDDKNYR